MFLGERVRELRRQKNLSQGDIEERSGLLRCYLSRVENGHTVPGVETLEKLAVALEVPLYQLFYDGEEPPVPPSLQRNGSATPWGNSGEDARLLTRLRTFLGRMEPQDHWLLLLMAQKMARANGSKSNLDPNPAIALPKNGSALAKQKNPSM